jgi:hypothetical protein
MLIQRLDQRRQLGVAPTGFPGFGQVRMHLRVGQLRLQVRKFSAQMVGCLEH